MDRKKIRDLASKDLKIKTAKYLYTLTKKELINAVKEIGTPCVVKPLMSSIEIRIFAKPCTKKNRRMGVILAVDNNIKAAVRKAKLASKKKSTRKDYP